MKKFLKTKLGLSLVGILAIAAIAYAQTQFTEVNDLLFRSMSPQMRLAGTGSVRNLAGTGSGMLAHASPSIVTTASTRTLLVSECGAIVVGNATSGTQTFTLPGVANTGCTFTFVAGHASGEILVNAAAVATCVITSFAAVGADADTGIVTDTSCETGLKNTAATNAIGDSLTITADGTRWLGVGITSGVWAAQ